MGDLEIKKQGKINSSYLKSLDITDEFILPQYDGQSIVNIPGTIAEKLGVVEFNSSSTLKIKGQIPDEIDQVILILFDALSYHRFQQWCIEEKDLVWNKLLQGGLLAPLTSLCPSTTCAAITSFWTGSPAAQHGIMGYEMWLKEFGITANMIEHKPISYQGGAGNLAMAGFNPETFLPVDSITNSYQSAGIEVHAFQHFAIINSGLSRLFMGDAHRHAINTASDMWISIRELLENSTDQKKYIWAYWDRYDSISHFFGPDSERAKAEFLVFSRIFEESFLNELEPSIRENTLVIFVADHGQITTDRLDPQYQLINHPDFINMLHILPSGENRLAYLHIKPGQMEAVKDYIDITWPNQFLILDSHQAVEAGLFGPGTPHPEINSRIGDLIVAAKGNAYWWWAAKENPLIGRHGGLSSDEMMVPFLAAKL